MPELPEVETTRRGIAPHLLNRTIAKVVVRESRLRWPIPAELSTQLSRHKVLSIDRRGKYLLLGFSHGTVLIHLGMSGRLHYLPVTASIQKHDHVDFVLTNKQCLRYHDPRRFGAILWTSDAPETHPLLIHLGVEPLSRAFNRDYLFQKTRQRNVPIKTFLMNAQQVVGVGNIYANEALFLAEIRPQRLAKTLTLQQCDALVKVIKQVLRAAIRQGGTTLKDFTGSDGRPGYFAQQLNVYGRQDEACFSCGDTLQLLRLNNRATVYCRTCQL